MNWFSKLKSGLTKSTAQMTQGITSIFSQQKIDEHVLQDFEDFLLSVDFGPIFTDKMMKQIRNLKVDKEMSTTEIRHIFSQELSKIFTDSLKPLKPDHSHHPHVMMFVGVNGTGKTTTIGKIAHQLKESGYKVMIAAGDTFRAAAVEQLEIWATRIGCELIKKESGADPASLVFEALQKAKEESADVLLIDTAGRLQNKAHLMEELEKIDRVMKKIDPQAPHETFLTLDATTGQNAYSQVEHFSRSININGLIVTKLDGSSKAGVLVGLYDKFKIPIRAIGIGEQIDDLQEFNSQAYCDILLGLNEPGF